MPVYNKPNCRRGTGLTTMTMHALEYECTGSVQTISFRRIKIQDRVSYEVAGLRCEQCLIRISLSSDGKLPIYDRQLVLL